MTNTKIVQLVNTCRECPNRAYESGGAYVCTKMQGANHVPRSGPMPDWCPLTDYRSDVVAGSGWIPVTERLPEERTQVLTYPGWGTGGSGVSFDEWGAQWGWLMWIEEGGGPTHWMPVPTPPVTIVPYGPDVPTAPYWTAAGDAERCQSCVGSLHPCRSPGKDCSHRQRAGSVKARCGACNGVGGVSSQLTGVTVPCDACAGLGRAIPSGVTEVTRG